MGLDRIKRDIDAGKKVSQGKQIKEEKKSETSDQRLWRYTRFLYTVGKTALVTGLLASARMIEATNGESNKVTELADRMRHSTDKSLPKPDVPVVEAMPEAVSLPGGSTSSENLRELWPRLSEAMEKHFEERNHPSTSFRDGPKEAQGTSSEETSETHQREQDKGKDPLSSKREKIALLRSLMDKFKEDPEALHIFKQTFNEKQVRERVLLEGDSEIPAARTLLTDEKSTCQDLCSARPASVDCIKQCATPVSSNPSVCLDVSLSDVLAKVEPISGLPAPNQQVRLNYTLSVQNHCPQTITDVTYHVQGFGECMKTLQFFSADPSSVAPGDSAGVKAGQDPSLTASCNKNGWGMNPSYAPPLYLSSSISASGTETTTDLTVSSPSKTFIVLGNRPYVMSECHQTCPPATDTPSTPPATDTPSIVFVHGIKIGPEGPGGIPPYIPWKGSDSGWNCSEYWGDAMKFLDSHKSEDFSPDFRTIQYYKKDTNCQNGNDEGRYSSDLHHDLYKSKCTDYHAGKEGTTWEETNDESFYHLSCLFAQYLHHNFGQSNSDVILVAHSMGGIIVRETLYQMDLHADQHPFPPTIGRVTKAITFNTPHGGVPNAALFACGDCTQVTELVTGHAFMSELSKSGRNPQISGGFTDWTVIGSECDWLVLPPTAINMDASHAVVYPLGSNTCYNHTGALNDKIVD